MSPIFDLHQLALAFRESDIEWRIGSCGATDKKGPWAKCFAYITNRAIMERLDQVCNPENWKNEYKAGPQGGVLCGISIKIDGEWITKWDGADNTDFEAVKGGLSDSMKRAGVQWGIGRYLYSLEEGWADCSADKKQGYRWHQDKKQNLSFYWKPPSLPSWALPTESKASTSPVTTAVTAAASSMDVLEIEALCAKLGKSYEECKTHYKVTGTWTQSEATDALTKLRSAERSLAKSLDSQA